MEIIRDLLLLWILGALGGTGYILWTVYVRASAPAPPGGRVPQQVTTRRIPDVSPAARPAAPPSSAPVRTPPPPMAGEHQRRGVAPTVKLPAAAPSPPGARPNSEDEAVADLFGGLSEAKAKADAALPIAVPAPVQLALPKSSVEQAERIEERGFHVGTAKIETSKPAPPAGDAVPGQARTQTAELDDILKRIDAVLSESNAPQSEATIGGQQDGKNSERTMPLAQSPPTEKHERQETDPSQQKLF